MKRRRIFETVNGVSEDYLTDDQVWEQMSPEDKKNDLITVMQPQMQVVIQSTYGGLIREMMLERSGPLSYLRKELRRIDQTYDDCYRYISLTASGTTYVGDDARYHLYFNLI